MSEPSDTNYKHYLGDGVYVDYDGVYVVLTTQYGFQVTNMIVLEPYTVDFFIKWYEQLEKKIYSTQRKEVRNK